MSDDDLDLFHVGHYHEMTPRARRLPAVAALTLLALAVAACAGFPGFPETSTTLIVNKTTVPVSAEDSGSRRIVDPCSERTIEYHGTWGGDPESGNPVAEPLPPDAYPVTLESQFTRPFENAIHLTIVVDATHGGHVVEPASKDRSEPCAGVPPPPSVPASPQPSA
jgi:hypothetical protein